MSVQPDSRSSASALLYALHLPIFTDPEALIDLGVAAERAGWDGCLLWDHILGSQDVALPMPDPWVVLGGLAVRTQRLRIGTAITPLPRRRPQKLAREAVTVDHLSHGRMVLGVGLGNPLEAEYGAFGEPSDPGILAEMLDEGLEVLAGLWSGSPFSHVGAHYRVEHATFLPAPVQQPRIPIWVACTWPHRRPLDRAARWDGVVVARMSAGGDIQALEPDQVADVVATVSAGRDDQRPFDVAIVHPGLPPPPRAADYAAAGATWCLVAGWLDELSTLVSANPRRAGLRAIGEP